MNSTEPLNFLSNMEYFDNFVFQASRPQTIQRDEFLCNTYAKYEKLGFRFLSTPLEGAQRAFWIDKSFEKKLYKHLLSLVSTEKGFMKDLENYQKLKKVYSTLSKKLNGAFFSKEKLKLLMDEYNKAWGLIGEQTWMPFAIEHILDKEVIEKLRKRYPEDFEDMYSTISEQTILCSYQKMHMEMYRAIISGKDKQKTAENLAKRYYWSSEYSYIEPFLNKQYFINELKKISLDYAKEEYKKLSYIETRNRRRFEKTLSKIKDPILNLQARIINVYIYIRTDRVDVIRKLMAPFRNIYEQIAAYLKQDTGDNWTRGDVVKLLSSEISNYLLGKSIPDLVDLKNRESYIYVHDSGASSLITGKRVVNKIVSYLKEINLKDKTIAGKSASRGKIRGIAILVYSKSDLGKVTEENVLVARTTMVEYISAMKRAKAFVTAEGGITSHAAIVARELKKPCIVGTGNCMDVIKDGDEVEVDADKGVVRILT